MPARFGFSPLASCHVDNATWTSVGDLTRSYVDASYPCSTTFRSFGGQADGRDDELQERCETRYEAERVAPHTVWHRCRTP
jgi:hypothetical protein